VGGESEPSVTLSGNLTVSIDVAVTTRSSPRDSQTYVDVCLSGEVPAWPAPGLSKDFPPGEEISPSREPLTSGDADTGPGVWETSGAIPTTVQFTVMVALVAPVHQGLSWRDFFTVVAPLFSRMRRERLLDHPARELIMRRIHDRPGIHYRALLRDLDMANGTLAFHLSHLEKAGYVKCLKAHGRKHFYPTDCHPDSREWLETDSRGLIVKFLLASPGATRQEVAKALGFGQSKVSYHLTVLRSSGLLETRRVGAREKCFVRSP
jgi:DNA-binding transcriptional ArsR family regulator